MKIVYISLAKTGPNPDVDQVIQIGLLYDDTSKRFDEAVSFESLLRPEVIASTSPLSLWRHTDILKHLEDQPPNVKTVLGDMNRWFIALPEKELVWGGDNVWSKELPFLGRLLGRPVYEMNHVADCSFNDRTVDPIQLSLERSDTVPVGVNTIAKRYNISPPHDSSCLKNCITMAMITRRKLERET